jgi:hypothetical protein
MDFENPATDYVLAVKGNDGYPGATYWIREKESILDPRIARDEPPNWVDIDELHTYWGRFGIPRQLVDGGWEGPDNQPRRWDSLPIWWPRKVTHSSKRQRVHGGIDAVSPWYRPV